MKKILIWGTGQLSWHTLNNIDEKNIIGFIDSYKKDNIFANKPVYYPKDILGLDYDAILVSLLKTHEVKDTCAKLGIDNSRIIYVYGNVQKIDMNKDYTFVYEICGNTFGRMIENRYHLVREIDESIDAYNSNENYSIYFKEDDMHNTDYIRIKQLELLSQQIHKNGIYGDVAELGVFRGDFAKYINYYFQDRKIYLFDTFSGFDEKELFKEMKGAMLMAGRTIFQKTGEEIVMDKMVKPEQCIIKKGFFPDTAKNFENNFSFVSLDCDFEESLYQGLLYFYPRLSEGGYIMLHDYNNFLTCAKKSIKRYENEIGRILPKVPICDNQGTLIITK